ncbi:MAG: DNA polymerase III subunit chi [Proteobacteria bacterium]|nr:MAG: DNA polymerase III subunit chi [Pseudomonadota bacterium]
MGDVLFYHLTRSSPEETLLMLLPRALERGWQVELRCPDARRAEGLDKALWMGPEESFLPHGLAGGADDDQPVLLTDSAPETPRPCVMTVGSAPLTAQEASRAERTCILFDGHDPQAVEKARAQWREITGAGLTAQYWSQEDGGWQKKAESG